MESKLLALVLVFSSILLTSTFANASAAPFTQKDNEAKEEIFSSLGNLVNNSYSLASNVTVGLHNGSIFTIYNQSEAPPIPPINNTGNGTGGNGTTGNGTTTPPTCPTGQHYNTTTTQCEDDVIVIPPPPPPPMPTDKPNPNFNTTAFLRVGTIGDIDDNNGLSTQLSLFKKYHTQVLFVIGDYGYKNCQAVVDKIKAAGFTSANARIVQGNHDCSAVTKAFNGMSQLYGSATFASGKLELFLLDGNTGLTCSSSQFAAMKPKIESSDAWYNIVGIHQPFVTAKSDHSSNGQFACWDPVFRANGVNPVLQAHNHNYQRFDVNGIVYAVVGTGTHDTGSSMYPINSDNWSGFKCLSCIEETNGVTIMDLQIDNPMMRHMHGWFISNGDTVKDSFHK